LLVEDDCGVEASEDGAGEYGVAECTESFSANPTPLAGVAS
jgi:hypothetical protein